MTILEKKIQVSLETYGYIYSVVSLMKVLDVLDMEDVIRVLVEFHASGTREEWDKPVGRTLEKKVLSMQNEIMKWRQI